jgi:hypothetical protein
MRLTDLKVLSDTEIATIHENSLIILESVGLQVESKKVLDLLYQQGCQVDFKNERVRFPRAIVEKCLLTVPAEIPIYQRDGNLAFILGDGGRYCVSGHNAVFVINEIIITYFLTSTYNTLPIYLYGMLRFGLSPEVYAISTVVLGFSILLIILMAKYTGSGEEKVMIR